MLTALRSERIPINMILADYETFNCRTRPDESSVASLAADIAKRDLAQDIVVMESHPHIKEAGFPYTLLCGFRRTMAVQLLGWKDIPAKVYPCMTDDEAMALNFAENEERRNLTFSETAMVVERFRKRGTTNLKEISRLLGKTNHEWVRLRVMYLELPQEFKDAIDNGLVNQVEMRKLYTVNNQDGLEAASALLQKLVRRRKLTVAPPEAAGVGEPKQYTALPSRIRNNSQVRLMLYRMRRIFPNTHIDALLEWVLSEITDEVLQARLDEYYSALATSSTPKLSDIWNSNVADPLNPGSAPCTHEDFTVAETSPGNFVATCTKCKRTGEEMPDEDAAIAMLFDQQ